MMHKLNMLKVEQQLCLNHRLKQMNCGMCQEACSKQAIHFDGATASVVIDDQCNQCGVCLRHCPARAIQWSDIGRYPLRSENGSVEIYCRKLKCDGYVGCLANLTEDELVYLALHANICLCVDEAVCKQCAVNVEEEVGALLQNANAFLEKIGGGLITLSRRDKQAAEQLNRRELFGFFFAKMKQTIVEALPTATEAADYRGMLLAALPGREGAQKIASAAPLFWGLQAEDCGMCGRCVRICKNGALRIAIDEEQAVSRLEHNQSQCCGCGACQKICGRGTLRLASEFSSLSAVAGQQTVVVAERTMPRCRTCQRLFIDDGTDLCAVCKRRQSKKMQAIY